MFEHDSTIGKFTNEFIANLSQALASKNIKTPRTFKTPQDSKSIE
jgi:hypothetical protein